MLPFKLVYHEGYDLRLGEHARKVEDTVRIHVNTVIAAREAAAVRASGANP
jgi:hypothetical protein